MNRTQVRSLAVDRIQCVVDRAQRSLSAFYARQIDFGQELTVDAAAEGALLEANVGYTAVAIGGTCADFEARSTL